MKRTKMMVKLCWLVPLMALFQTKGFAADEPVKYPDQAIRLVVPFAAGGGVDTAARLVAKQMQGKLGVNILVDNRPGGNGTIGGKIVQSAPADGYTLLFSAATHILAKEVMSSVPYDPIADFMPVARVGEAPLLMVISPKFKGKKLNEVMAAAKARPEEWNAAIPAMGAPSHLATLLMAKKSNLNFALVPYKGTAPALIDVAGQYGVHAIEHGNMSVELKEYTYQGAWASERKIAGQRDMLVRGLAAYGRLYRFVQQPDSLKAFVKARKVVFPRAPDSEHEVMWNYIQTYRPFAVNIAVSPERLRYMQELNVSFKVQQHVLPFERVADMSLAADAVKLLGGSAPA